MIEDDINKIDYFLVPADVPDTDDGNLRLYYELELLRSKYQSDMLEKQIRRYIEILDVLGERGLWVDFSSDLKIDRDIHKRDWQKK